MPRVVSLVPKSWRSEDLQGGKVPNVKSRNFQCPTVRERITTSATTSVSSNLRLLFSTNLLDREILTARDLLIDDELLRSMACCHSLTRIENELSGDPLDLILFRETGWLLEEPDVVEESGRFDLLAPTVVRPPDRSYEIGILRQFTFR